ncbi:gag/pol protein [Cucumis melo var. makuwa]|uniref:Gag/pol protein n=1 Tax=Cucumis melo var. makuwa TaxID=1194695 RepID=A0A5A7SHR7_CUCMM|nr:gag/pol protein [Cucumis melo var. makuwa]
MWMDIGKETAPSTLLRRKKRKETTSFKQLEKGEMTLKGYVAEIAVHILNNVPSKSVSEAPFELLRERKPSLSHFRIWGYREHVLVTNSKKLEPRSRLCQFVGYPKEMRGGLLFDLQENRVFISTNATFLEEDHMRDHKARSKLVLNEATDASTRVVIPDDGVEDPLTYKQAMNDVDKDQRVKAIDLEMESMYFNSRHVVHLSKEQCHKRPQEVEDMRLGIVSRYQSNPGKDYWTTIKIILNKSTSGSMFTLNERAVVWHSIKKGCIADSTMKANVATCKATKEAVWLKKFLHDLEVVPNMNLLSLYIVIIVEQ